MGKSKKSPPPPSSGSGSDFTVTITKGDEILLSADITIGAGLGFHLGRFILEIMETIKGGGGGNSHAIFPDGRPHPRGPRRGKPNKNKGKKKRDDDFISTKQ